MITISLCMIVRNEEEGLGRCLDSVKDIADEIVIVDTGSTDHTKEVAARYGAVLYDFEWINDFGAARNYSFSKATQEYILWLDADDIIEEADQARFKRLKETLSSDIQTVTMVYNLAFDADGKPTVSLRRNRLVRRECGFQWIGPVHEYLAVSGAGLDSDVAVTHKKNKVYTDRNLSIYRERQARNEDFSPRDLYYFANELREHQHYEEALDYYGRFLETGQGWVEDVYQACLKMAECHARLGHSKERITALTETLQFDIPRSEFCCQMGGVLLEEGKYQQAAYWFEQAAVLPLRPTHGIQDMTTATWLPHLQLCICYDRLGQHERANFHNEVAYTYSPSHPSVLYNRDYFKGLLGEGRLELAPAGSLGKERSV